MRVDNALLAVLRQTARPGTTDTWQDRPVKRQSLQLRQVVVWRALEFYTTRRRRLARYCQHSETPIGQALSRVRLIDRPRAVLAIAATLSLATVVATVTGLSLLFPGPVWERMWALNRPAYVAFARFGMLSGATLLGLAAVAGATAMGLLRRRRWAWLAAISLFAVNGLGDVITLVSTHDLARSGSGVLVATMFLYLLMRPEVS